MRFWYARIAGTMANQMLMLAVGWEMYALTGSAWDLGLVGLLQFLPALLLTLVAGHVADHHDRSRILAGHFKLFNAALCTTCTDGAKAVYLRIGKPRSLRTAGTIFFGPPYRMITSLPIPPRTQPDAELWISIEGWDGSLHQASIPLAQASPATVAWLNRQGAKK